MDGGTTSQEMVVGGVGGEVQLAALDAAASVYAAIAGACVELLGC